VTSTDVTDSFDFRAVVRPGDTVLWPQGSGEPTALTSALVRQRADLGGITVFVATTLGATLQPEHVDHIRFLGLGGLGETARLSRRGLVEVMPARVSTLPSLLRTGQLSADVVLVQVSPPDENGQCSLGLVTDYVRAAVDQARTVVAEVNAQVPRTRGDTAIAYGRFDHVLHTDRPPLTVRPGEPSAAVLAVAKQVAALVPDGATLQLGIGGVPDALARFLGYKADLGVHSGMIGDWVPILVEAGVITNSRKPVDCGVTVTGALFGTERLYRWADDNPRLCMRALDGTHGAAALSALPDLWAINSAIEVDLTGQINAEMMNGAYVGGIGGQLDFARAACSSRRGRSVVALASTAARGTVSRIVTRLPDEVVTTPRADADLVVTEFGVADLRGATLHQRAARLMAIAHPAHRAALEQVWVDAGWPHRR
jgi:acyl-CoA hydrolase